MLAELRYSIATYPILYGLWAAVLLAWLSIGLRGLGILRRAPRTGPRRYASRRLWRALGDSLVQRPIWRLRAAGAMHTALFWGSLLVVASSVGTHLVVPRGEPWRHSHAWHALGDGGLGLVIVGLVLAVWRRSARHQLPSALEDVLLWAWAALLVATTLFSNALLIDVANPPWARSAILSGAVARLLAWVPPTVQRTLYGWSWSLLHALLVGAALILPFSKWRHLVLAPMSLLARREMPLAVLEAVDLETDQAIGLATRRDLKADELVQMYACTRCGRCTRSCPANTAGGALDPMQLLEQLRGSMGDGHHPQGAATHLGDKALWECTTCMACDDACPVGISPMRLLVNIRRERVLEAASFPAPLRSLFDNLERHGNPWGLPNGERAAMAEAMGLPVLAPGGETDVLLWLGCMAAHDARGKQAVKALARLLEAGGVRAATLGKEEACCGDPLRRAGSEYLWRERAQANLRVLGARRFGQLVSLCPHCVNALGNEYAELGGPIAATHATQFVSSLLRSGRLALATPSGEPRRVTFHDPCYLGRGAGQYQAARELLAAIPGVQFVEMPRHGRDALCCGGGGGRMWLDSPQEERLSAQRADEAARTAPVCTTACPFCATMLASDPRAIAAGLQVSDVVQLLAAAALGVEGRQTWIAG